MSQGRHIAGETRSGRVSWGALGLALGLFMAMAIPAGAAVERYQFTDYTINVDSVNNNASYTHTFEISLDNPCTDSYSGTGSYVGPEGSWDETLSDFSMNGDTLSFKAVYQGTVNPGYTWYPSFTLNEDGSLTFVDDHGPDNVWGATGDYTVSQTSYNHGEYVAESIDDYGPDADSCIGMPIVSKSR